VPDWSASEILDAMRGAGFPESELARAYAIGLGESGWSSGAVNDGSRTATDEYSVGPWQINLKAHPGVSEACARDLECSTQVAFGLFQKQGWQPWGAYTNGSYRQYMSVSQFDYSQGDPMVPKNTLPPGFRFRKTPATKIDGQGNKYYDITPMAGGGVIVRYADGDYDLLSQQDLFGSDPTTNAQEVAAGHLGVSQGNLALNQQQEARNAAAQQAQTELSKAQFEYQKAKDNKDFAAQQYWQGRADYWQSRSDELNRLQLNVSRGNTLLGLGSRPETLLRYLWALRGKQAPQGGAVSDLPGYTPNEIAGTLAGTGVTGGGPPSAMLGGGPPGPAAGAGAGVPGENPAVTAVKNAIATPGAPLGQFVAPGGTNITQTDPRLGPNPPGAGQGPSNELLGAQDKLINEGRTPRFFSNGVAIFKHGGPIPEHVIGIGMKTGKPYEFGEAGKEYVVPHDKLAQLMGMVGKEGKRQSVLDMKKTGTTSNGVTKYAAGGLIGDEPSFGMPDQGSLGGRQTPSFGGDQPPDIWGGPRPGPWEGDPRRLPSFAPETGGGKYSGVGNPIVGGGAGGAVSPFPSPSAGLFNPPGLNEQVNAPTLTGGIPTPPQLSLATGGTSLLSSAQRQAQMTPSERLLYEGALTDLWGVQPGDVAAMRQSLSPQGGQVRGGGYRSSY
jgi:hypothetical protein